MGKVSFEGNTLEEAYESATSTLKCSITDLHIEVIQSPTKGFLGLFAKQAIITVQPKQIKHSQKTSLEDKDDSYEYETLNSKLEALHKKETIKTPKVGKLKKVNKEKIFDDFYVKEEETLHKAPIVQADNQKLKKEIKKNVDELFAELCYKIDEVIVDIIDEGATVYIEFNGEDSALLIGKEGYRYKALSYILFNWINEKYRMMLRLEVAEFLTTQETAIHNYLEPVITAIKSDGFYKTKPLDGILVHIALTKLRDEFPDKYVAVKTNVRGEKYILVNEYKNGR
jgi:spoIIIJ-associated protein